MARWEIIFLSTNHKTTSGQIFTRWKIEKEEKAAQQKQKRGKAGKMKKIKDKYGDQDEEDRQAAMDLLHGAQSERKGKRKQKKENFKEPKNQRGQKQKPKEKEGNVFQRAAEELAPPEAMENPDDESVGNTHGKNSAGVSHSKPGQEIIAKEKKKRLPLLNIKATRKAWQNP